MKCLLCLCLFLSPALAEEPTPLIIAHRGASGYLPEHTLAAKALAFGQGAHYLEQDLVLSKDNVPVVLHDIHVDAVSDVAEKFPGRQREDGRFYALDFTVEELKTLRITERFNPKTGKQVYPKRFTKGVGEFRIVTFEEELAFVAELNRSAGRTAGVFPEIKQPAWHREQGRDISPVVVALLHKFGYEDKADPCYIQCFDHAEVLRLRNELGWKGRLVQLNGAGKNDKLLTPDGLAELAKVVDATTLPVIDKEGRVTDLAKQAHAVGLKVLSGTTFRIDELPPYAKSPEDLLKLWQEAGVDGFFTDFPDVCLKWHAK